ncbi:MAG TPA: hypothetical protein VK364_12785, partial [Hymenobacter sp.]|nr:hypothetical protein [Hymenobacter sp.]
GYECGLLGMSPPVSNSVDFDPNHAEMAFNSVDFDSDNVDLDANRTELAPNSVNFAADVTKLIFNDANWSFNRFVFPLPGAGRT